VDKLQIIEDLLIGIRDRVDDTIANLKVTPNQITITALSELSRYLGLIEAGEFRSGNGIPPGSGFTGMRIAYPPMEYNDELWNLVGVEEDIMQVGINATTGKLTAGEGKVIIDENGLSIIQGTASGRIGQYAPNGITFLDATGGSSVGDVYNYLDGATNFTKVRVLNGIASLESVDANGIALTRIAVHEDGVVELTGTNIKIGADSTATLNDAGVVYPNTWTPTLFLTTNVAAATAYLCHYARIGNLVVFGGIVAMDIITAGANTVLGMSLPIASAFAAGTELAGTAETVYGDHARLYADAANDRISLQSSAGILTATLVAWSFYGIYKIL
jgi:hypothetical protein